MVEAECSRMSLLLGLWAEEGGHWMPLASPLNRREADLPVRLSDKAREGARLWHTGEHSGRRASPSHLRARVLSRENQSQSRTTRHTKISEALQVGRVLSRREGPAQPGSPDVLPDLCSGLHCPPYMAPSRSPVGEMCMTESDPHILFQIINSSRFNPQLLLKCYKKLNTIFSIVQQLLVTSNHSVFTESLAS